MQSPYSKVVPLDDSQAGEPQTEGWHPTGRKDGMGRAVTPTGDTRGTRAYQGLPGNVCKELLNAMPDGGGRCVPDDDLFY